MTEPDCGCRVNVLVSAPGAAGYTVGVNDTTFHFCPLHKAAPDLLAALEETRDELRRIHQQLSEGKGIDMWGLSGLPMLVGHLQFAIAKARLCAGTK